MLFAVLPVNFNGTRLSLTYRAEIWVQTKKRVSHKTLEIMIVVRHGDIGKSRYLNRSLSNLSATRGCQWT